MLSAPINPSLSRPHVAEVKKVSSSKIGLFSLIFVLLTFLVGAIQDPIGKVPSIFRLSSELIVGMVGLSTLFINRSSADSYSLALRKLGGVSAIAIIGEAIVQNFLYPDLGFNPVVILKRISFFIFLFYAVVVRKKISVLNFRFFAIAVLALILPFAIKAFKAKGFNFHGSYQATPLIDSHDTAFILGIIFIWSFLSVRLGKKGWLRNPDLYIAGFSLIFIVCFKVFAVLLLCGIVVVLTLGKEYSIKVKKNINRNLIFVFGGVLFFIVKRLSDLTLAKSQNNGYLFSNNLGTFGNGRVGAWLQILSELRNRGVSNILFGTGIGTDLHNFLIWKETLSSHSILLTWITELGIVGAGFLVFIFYKFFMRIGIVQKHVFFAVIVTSLMTSGLIGLRTFPAAFFAIFVSQLRFFEEDRASSTSKQNLLLASS